MSVPGQGGVEFRVGADAAQFQKTLDEVVAKFRAFESAVGGFNAAPKIATANEKLDQMAGKFTKIGNTISRGVNPLFNAMLKGITLVSGAMSLLTGISLKIGGNFEQEMTGVGIISHATAEELSALTEKARELGRELPRSAAQAAEAMKYLAQKGWDISRIQGTVGDVMNLSISQNYGLAESANLLSGVMAAYKLEAVDAARVTDIMNNAANQSALTMEKLGTAYQYAAPVANAFGVSLETLTSHFAVLANQNLDGSTMGAGWRMVMQKVAEAAGDGGLAFRRLGVEVQNADGSVRNITEVFEDLGKFLADNPNRASEIMKLFGTRAGTVGVILAQSAGQLKNYEKSLVELGSTQAAVTKRMQDWNMVWETFKSARDDTVITYFNQLKSSVIPLTQRLTGMTNAFNKWLRESNMGERAIMALGRGLGFTTDMGWDFEDWLAAIDLNAVTSRFEKFGEGVANLGKAFLTLMSTVPWKAIADNLGTIITVITGFWLTGKVLTVIGNVMKLGHAFIWLGQNPIVAALLAVAAAAAVVSSEVAKSAKAVKEANADWEASVVSLQQAEAYLAASQGDENSFHMLDPDHQKRLLEVFAKDEALILKFGEQYQRMIKFRAKELNIQLKSALTPNGLEIQKIFDTYANEDLMVSRMKDFIGPTLLEAWSTAGKQGVDKYMLGFESLPEAVRKVVGRAADEIIKARQTRADAGVDKNLLLSEDAVGQAMEKLKELSDMSQQTAKDLGVPLDKMGKVFGEQFAKAVGKILEEMEEISGNPFLSLAILKEVDTKFAESGIAATDFGKAGVAAFRETTKAAEDTKQAIAKMRDELAKSTEPLQMLVEAIKGGFLKGAALDDAKKLITQLTAQTKSSEAGIVKARFEEFGLEVSDAMLKGLSASASAKTLEGVGLEKAVKKLPDTFGDFVRATTSTFKAGEEMVVKFAATVDEKINKTSEAVRRSNREISQVTTGVSSDKVGQSITEGISKPSETGIKALDTLHRAAIRAFDVIIEKGKASTAVMASLALAIGSVGNKLGSLSSLDSFAVAGKEMATPTISKGLLPKSGPLMTAGTSGNNNVDARSDIKVDVQIQHLEVGNKEEAGGAIAKEIANRAGQQLQKASNKYHRDILGALTY